MQATTRAVLLAAAAASCVLNVGRAQESRPAYQSILRDGVPVKEAWGVWQSHGYGWVLEISRGGMAVYHQSTVDCSKDPRTTNFLEQFAFRRVDSTAHQLVTTTQTGENDYVFSRLQRLPVACTRPNWSPQRKFEHFAATYQEQYAFFKERGLNWEERVRSNRPLVSDKTSDRVLFAIFSDMLDSLGDAHVGMTRRSEANP